MFLSALQPYVVFIIIAVVLMQYAFAIFCLLKLAYMDLDKNRYILWNLFILIVLFIGGAVFLVYYSKHPELRIPKDAPLSENIDGASAEQSEDDNAQKAENGENTEETPADTENTENE